MDVKKWDVGDILMLAMGVLYFALIHAVFYPCDPLADGTFMSCHWAHQAISGCALALFALSVFHLILKNKGIKIGLDIAAIVIALLAMGIPGKLINLCMMPEMRCRMLMAPGTMVLSVLTMIAALVDIFLHRIGSEK